MFDIGWFPVGLSHEAYQALMAAELAACELRVSGIDGRDDLFEAARDFLTSAALRYCFLKDMDVWLYSSTGSYEPRNRIRTYKGVFWGLGKVPRRAATEVERVAEGESIIGGLLRVEKSWFNQAWYCAANQDRNSFLVGEKHAGTVPADVVVEKALDALVGPRRYLTIDYPTFVVACSGVSHAVLRRGGGTCEEYVNLTLFGPPDLLKGFERCLRGAFPVIK